MDVLKDYQARTFDTAIYPEANSGSNMARAYAFAGLASECGELLIAQGHENIVKEFGDVLWYLARICEETAIIEFEELVKIRTQPDFTVIPSSMIIGLSKLGDAIKKRMRDGVKDSDTENKRAEMIEYGLITVLSAALQYTVYVSDAAGFNYTETDILNLAASGNIKKLESRKERSTLEGSGDER